MIAERKKNESGNYPDSFHLPVCLISLTVWMDLKWSFLSKCNHFLRGLKYQPDNEIVTMCPHERVKFPLD